MIEKRQIYYPSSPIHAQMYGVPTCCGLGVIYINMTDYSELDLLCNLFDTIGFSTNKNRRYKDRSFFIKNNPIANMLRLATNFLSKNNLFIVKDEDIPFIRDMFRILKVKEYEKERGHTIFFSADTIDHIENHLESHGYFKPIETMFEDKRKVTANTYAAWLAAIHCEDAMQIFRRRKSLGY